jgi:predicted metal-binding membrane protein
MTMTGGSILRAPRGRERTVIALCLAVMLLLSWLYIVALADAMDAMQARRASVFMPLMPMGTWGPFELALCLAMWAIMMIAMMVPSATPMLLAFHAVARGRLAAQSAARCLAAFLAGYIVVWTGFSAVATTLQWWLHETEAVTELMVSASRMLDAALLVVAGIWQFVPAKSKCLTTCRTPLGFLLTEWRDGANGAFVMGLRHGMVCVTCCWALMALLFVAGVMNLRWIALLSVAVLAEKMLPFGMLIARVFGVALCAAGFWLLAVA